MLDFTVRSGPLAGQRLSQIDDKVGLINYRNHNTALTGAELLAVNARIRELHRQTPPCSIKVSI